MFVYNKVCIRYSEVFYSLKNHLKISFLTATVNHQLKDIDSTFDTNTPCLNSWSCCHAWKWTFVAQFWSVLVASRDSAWGSATCAAWTPSCHLWTPGYGMDSFRIGLFCCSKARWRRPPPHRRDSLLSMNVL